VIFLCVCLKKFKSYYLLLIVIWKFSLVSISEERDEDFIKKNSSGKILKIRKSAFCLEVSLPKKDFLVCR